MNKPEEFAEKINTVNRYQRAIIEECGIPKKICDPDLWITAEFSNGVFFEPYWIVFPTDCKALLVRRLAPGKKHEIVDSSIFRLTNKLREVDYSGLVCCRTNPVIIYLPGPHDNITLAIGASSEKGWTAYLSGLVGVGNTVSSALRAANLRPEISSCWTFLLNHSLI